LSRALAMPTYLSRLQVLSLGEKTLDLLDNMSFYIMCLALIIGAVIILKAIFTGILTERRLPSRESGYRHA
ncbi:MAG: hypothetical protein ACLFUE_07795, partial [Desulfobacteraceae bacterium]